MKDTESVKELIAEYVSLGDILRDDGKISLNISEEQFSCTFHGPDHKKSARYYHETDSAYCWTCKERWDLYSYIMRRDGISFAETLRFLIQQYKIDLSKLPDIKGAHKRRQERKAVTKLDSRKIPLEKLKKALHTARDDLEFETYRKFVHGYMFLKYITPEEKFQESAEILRQAMLAAFERVTT